MIRKGSVVRYIGDNPLLQQYNNYTVKKRSGNLILIYIPVVYLDGSVHKVEAYENLAYFEEISVDK